MKLNLGCGTDKISGYANIDIRPEVDPDMIMDLNKTPYPFDTNSIDEIKAKDFIEHFSFRRTKAIVSEWFRILKQGGKMYIQCPDLEAITTKVVMDKKRTYEEMSYWVYGGQEYPQNLHQAGFTNLTLTRLLESAGFKVESVKNDGGTNLICWVVKP